MTNMSLMVIGVLVFGIIAVFFIFFGGGGCGEN